MNMEDDERAAQLLRRRKVLKCGYCKPHKYENAGRKPRTDKYKNHRP